MNRGQVDRLYDQLSARERAVLVIRHAHEDTREPPALRSRMPREQVAEFNHFIGLGNVLGRTLAIMTVIRRQEAEALQLRSGYLWVLPYAVQEREHLYGSLWPHTREPVTQSEYDALLEEARGVSLPLDEAVEIVAEAREDEWETDDEWARLERDVAKELRAAAKENRPVARGRGRTFAIEAGSLYDWLGLPVPLSGEYGYLVEVVTEDRAEWASVQRKRLREGHELRAIDPRALRADAEPQQHEDRIQAAAVAIAQRVGDDHGRLRGQFTALDGAYPEIVHEFGDEDVVDPSSARSARRPGGAR